MTRHTPPYIINIYDYAKHDWVKRDTWYLMTIDKYEDGVSEPYKTKTLFILAEVFQDKAFNTLITDRQFIERKLFILKNHTRIRKLKVEYSLEMEV